MCKGSEQYSNLHSPSWKLYPIAKTIRLKCDALSVCIIYEKQPDNRIMQAHTGALVSSRTAISRHNIPTLNESLQTFSLENRNKTSILGYQVSLSQIRA